MPTICRNCASRFNLATKGSVDEAYGDYELKTPDGVVCVLVEYEHEDSKYCNAYDRHPFNEKLSDGKPSEVFKNNTCPYFMSIEDNLAQLRRHVPNWLGLH